MFMRQPDLWFPMPGQSVKTNITFDPDSCRYLGRHQDGPASYRLTEVEVTEIFHL